MCSCTIVSQDYVLARSSCIKNGTTGKVQVHAGALNSSNANQIVGASLLATSEPPPEGVVALKLDVQLSFNEYVSVHPAMESTVGLDPGPWLCSASLTVSPRAVVYRVILMIFFRFPKSAPSITERM